MLSWCRCIEDVKIHDFCPISVGAGAGAGKRRLGRGPRAGEEDEEEFFCLSTEDVRWAVIGGDEVTWPQCSPLIGPQVHARHPRGAAHPQPQRGLAAAQQTHLHQLKVAHQFIVIKIFLENI